MSKLTRLDVDPDPGEEPVITLRSGTMVVITAGSTVDAVVAMVVESEVIDGYGAEPDKLRLVLVLPESLEEAARV